MDRLREEHAVDAARAGPCDDIGQHQQFVADFVGEQLGQFLACLPGVGVPYVYALSSGVGMALALAALMLTVHGMTRSLRAGCLAAALLGGAHMAWWLSTLAEVYTWSLALLMLELTCLVRALRARSFAWFAVLSFSMAVTSECIILRC